MGIKRGAFESTSLGNTATSAKNTNVQIDSVARGMRAFGAGLGAVADFCGKMAGMADKAYSAKSANFASATKSLKALTNAKANLSMMKDAYKDVDTPESRLAIHKAEQELREAQNASDQALDAYARTGVFYKQLGTPNVASGAKRREAAEKRVAERIANGEDKDKVGGILGNVEHQSFFGAVLENW